MLLKPTLRKNTSNFCKLSRGTVLMLKKLRKLNKVTAEESSPRQVCVWHSDGRCLLLEQLNWLSRTVRTGSLKTSSNLWSVYFLRIYIYGSFKGNITSVRTSKQRTSFTAQLQSLDAWFLLYSRHSMFDQRNGLWYMESEYMDTMTITFWWRYSMYSGW